MKRQRVRTNRETGMVEHYYEDCGPKAAYPGHGRPMHSAVPQEPVNDVMGRQTMPYRTGFMQFRLPAQ